MYLSENKSLRMLTLCALYVAQGIPFGFVTVTFAAWLATPENGLTTEQLGPILAMATLPWSFKFFWGPLMDRFTFRSFGKRRPWIIFAQGMAVLVLASMMLFDDLPGMVWTTLPDTNVVLTTLYRFVPGPLAALILVANVFVSMQDVAVDALAVDLLKEEERGVANGLMYGSSYLGTAIGGAGLGWVVAQYGIQAGLLGQAVMLLGIMMIPVFVRERPTAEDAGTTRSEGQAVHSGIPDEDRNAGNYHPAGAGHTDFGEIPLAPPAPDESHSVTRNLLRAFSLRSTLIGALIAVTVRIGIGVLTAVFVDYLMKEGGWTQDEYTAVTGGWAVMLGLCGSAIGGFVADIRGPRPLILLVSVTLGVLWISIGVVPGAIESKTAIKAMLLTQEFLFSVLSVSLFSLFMSISWPRVAATQFTAYMALMNLSATIGSYLAAQLTVSFSILQILVLAGIIQMLIGVPVLLVDVKQTRRVLGEC